MMGRLLMRSITVTILMLFSMVIYANNYPTEDRVDYVIGCMASNGQNKIALKQCSCSIDHIASILPYKAYEQAQTISSLRLSLGGERVALYRNSQWANEKLDALKIAIIEADLACFRHKNKTVAKSDN